MEGSTMATIHDITASRKAALRYDATYGHLYGIATQVAEGYAFRPDTTQGTRLISATDPALVLLGRCDLADAARAADEGARGLAARVCGTDTGRP
jgi:hypothetical protein